MNAIERKAMHIKRQKAAKSLAYYNARPDKMKVLSRIGEYWDKREELRLINRFARDMTIEMMCKVHRRDVGGIITRLNRLGLITTIGRNHVSTIDGVVIATFNDIKEIKKRLNKFVELKS